MTKEKKIKEELFIVEEKIGNLCLLPSKFEGDWMFPESVPEWFRSKCCFEAQELMDEISKLRYEIREIARKI